MARRLTGLFAVLVLLLSFTGFQVIAQSAPGADEVAAARADLMPLLTRLVQPLGGAPPEGKAWVCNLQVQAGDKSGRLLVAWDASRLALRLAAAKFGEVHLGILPDRSWMFLPRHNVLYRGQAAQPAKSLPGTDLQAWPRLKGLFAGSVIATAMAPVPKHVQVHKIEDGGWRITDTKRGIEVILTGDFCNFPVSLTVQRRIPQKAAPERLVVVRLAKCGLEDAARLSALLRPPAAPGREQNVDDADLRAMVAWTVDVLSEQALYRIGPAAPPHFPGIQRRQGKVVAVFRGAPEEMGRQHGTLFRTAVRDNVHRVVHAIGMVRTVMDGEWLPGRLYEVWKRQKPYIPDRLITEMDALADAAGLPRRWVYAANVYPELFHCSGLALRGKATQDGRLLHGRILDYLTEGGLQLNAAVMVFVPDHGNAWVNIGYAGCIGSVTAMNEKGLTMGEMGGRGENYLDGLPMMLLVREVMERFDNVPDALAWIRKTPRTCEYFYVLSDAHRNAVGLASWARALAQEKGRKDLDVVEPGQAHPLLPHPVPDCVLLSAGARYENLVRRVRENYGRITPDVAWKIMGEGVAMKSNLHIALFRPETLDFWLADAGPRGEPAWTQARAHFNLRDLLTREGAAAAAASTKAGAR